MTDEILLDLAAAEELSTRACLKAGANEAATRSLVDATISAAIHSQPGLGFPHFVDYLHSFREGRINCDPKPTLSRPFPAFLTVDADRGIAQLCFDLVFDDIISTVHELGVAVLTVENSYTTGELGYYLRRLSAEGVVGLAATNANAFMVVNPGGPAVYSTNPIGFSFPMGVGSAPLVVDQSASATAYVKIVAAAAEGATIPEGWAVDEQGNDTTDSAKALAGSLLPFGGRKGANMALIVEMLSAGLSGGNWSLDAPPFNAGPECPAVGLTIVAMMPGGSGNGRVERARKQVDRLRGNGVYVPGIGGEGERAAPLQEVRVPPHVYDAICKFADG